MKPANCGTSPEISLSKSSWALLDAQSDPIRLAISLKIHQLGFEILGGSLTVRTLLPHRSLLAIFSPKM